MKESASRRGSQRRFNALTGDWVLVSEGRTNRPWQGATQTEAVDPHQLTDFDPECYLCPGNTRVNGTQNPDYTSVFTFDNDFSAFAAGKGCQAQPNEKAKSNELFRVQQEFGVCRVMCFSPQHNLTLPLMSQRQRLDVVEAWVNETEILLDQSLIRTVQIFENRGSAMGCSNPHPHGQIWAQASIPTHLEREIKTQEAYRERHGVALLDAYRDEEYRRTDRLVIDNGHFLVVVPHWALWPFETLVLCREPVSRLDQLSNEQRSALADIVGRLTVRYDNLFCTSFPYSAGIHQAPRGAQYDSTFRLHMHFYPPLLRSASVQKFVVGYEMLAEAQRDLTPESAADILRSQSDIHYSERSSNETCGSAS